MFAQSGWRGIAGVCIPSLLSIVAMLLYNIADMYFVGWMGKVSAAAAATVLSTGLGGLAHTFSNRPQVSYCKIL